MTPSHDIIKDIRATDLKFSRTPDTLKRNLCTPTSRFKNDARSRDAQWFGPVALTLVEVETHGGQIGHGTIGFLSSYLLLIPFIFLYSILVYVQHNISTTNRNKN